MSDKPLFVIKRNLQKSAQTGLTFQDQLDNESLKDICLKITGRSDYNCQYVDNDYSDDVLSNTYNKGRLATLRYDFICKNGNPATDYHMFIYRLMQTVGFIFLNFPNSAVTTGFVTIEDMMRARDENRGTNRSNNSTYISKNEDGVYEAYCKTYGASKYNWMYRKNKVI